MSVKIRMSRHGARKRPFYRVVVADSRFPRDGRLIDQLGTYDPLTAPVRVEINREKLEKWLARGVLPTDTVARVLKKAGLPHRAEPAPAEAPASA